MVQPTHLSFIFIISKGGEEKFRYGWRWRRFGRGRRDGRPRSGSVGRSCRWSGCEIGAGGSQPRPLGRVEESRVVAVFQVSSKTTAVDAAAAGIQTMGNDRVTTLRTCGCLAIRRTKRNGWIFRWGLYKEKKERKKKTNTRNNHNFAKVRDLPPLHTRDNETFQKRITIKYGRKSSNKKKTAGKEKRNNSLGRHDSLTCATHKKEKKKKRGENIISLIENRAGPILNSKNSNIYISQSSRMHNAHAGGCGAVSRPSRVPKKARRQPGPFLFFFSHVIHNKGDDDRDESDRHDFSFKVAHLHQPPQTTRWQMFEKKKRKKKLRAIGPALDLYASLDVISVRGGDESTRSVPPRRTLCTGIILQVTTPSLSFLCLLLLLLFFLAARINLHSFVPRFAWRRWKYAHSWLLAFARW